MRASEGTKTPHISTLLASTPGFDFAPRGEVAGRNAMSMLRWFFLVRSWGSHGHPMDTPSIHSYDSYSMELDGIGGPTKLVLKVYNTLLWISFLQIQWKSKECLFHAWLQESPPHWNFGLDDHVKSAKCGGFTVDFEPFLESRSGIIEYCPSQSGWIVRIMFFFMVFLLFEALQILHSGVAAQLSGCGNQDIDSMTCQLHVTLLMWALWALWAVTMGVSSSIRSSLYVNYVNVRCTSDVVRYMEKMQAKLLHHAA